MKNRNITAFLMAAVLIAGSAFFAGCEKEEPTASLTQVAPKTSEEPPEGWGIHRTWRKDLSKCVTPAEACFDDIVITPGEKAYLSEIFEKGEDAITWFFTTEAYAEYFPGLKLEDNLYHLGRLQQEKYSATISQSGNQTFYLLENKEDKGETYQFVVVE